MMSEAVCDFLPWDSEFFGLRIARARQEKFDTDTLQAAREWCAVNGIDCLYVLATPDDPATLTALCAPPFKLVDMRLTFIHTLQTSSQSQRAGGLTIRQWQPDDVSRLRAMASTAYTDSRFYFDGGFARERCDELYATWAERSCHGYADFVLVAEHEGAPAAFITGTVREGVGQIGLVGVDAAVRGRGLGGAIVRAALAEFADRGAERVEVVTQGRNIGAQRIYQRAGFVTESIKVWFHGWFYSSANAPTLETSSI